MNPPKMLKEHGQVVWLDSLSRVFIANGDLKRLIDQDGLCGVTSNASIFEKAIDNSGDYDGEIRQRLQQGDCSVEQLYESPAIEDIRHAADVLRPVYDATEGADGYVGLEASPSLAMQAEATTTEARRLCSMWSSSSDPMPSIRWRSRRLKGSVITAGSATRWKWACGGLVKCSCTVQRWSKAHELIEEVEF